MTEQQRREAEKLAERAQEEEDKFTRVPLSKEEKKKARSLRRKVGMSTQLSDFGDDVSDLVRMAQRSEKNADESVASLAALHGLHGADAAFLFLFLGRLPFFHKPNEGCAC